MPNKKKQKENSDENSDISVIIAIGVIGILSLWILYFSAHTPSTYCKQNPDKCVLDVGKKYINYNIEVKYNDHYYSLKEWCTQGNAKLESEKYYCRLRKKTQEELDIDDCTNNPREDERCKCEEVEIKPFFNIMSAEVTTAEGFYCLNWSINDDDSATDNCGFGFKIYPQYEKYCINSIPKTECEKGNSNYIERLVDFEVINSSVTPHKECIMLDNNCVSAVRECREKTEVEKLMDKDCDELFYSLAQTYPVKNEEECKWMGNLLVDKICLSKLPLYSNLKQVWRQKRCSI